MADKRISKKVLSAYKKINPTYKVDYVNMGDIAKQYGIPIGTICCPVLKNIEQRKLINDDYNDNKLLS